MDLELLLAELGALYLEKRLMERENAALKGELAAARQRVTELEGKPVQSSEDKA